ncbi:dTDP-4-dehydrorhamnose reductase [Halopseudomonas salina]|uniref:dTDP-4-dehydrorhamnose reductase n=1 Tax=Halopseudomonas salina TaxID=1323744 RepID=A0ABQ1PLR8_9GAMM|nr:dTDP-4-dehydrorhamnose reductase [Halopseudomonas salina]GGC99351.1 NAD(P)-dependent oxidoreductase [Halopseudomonas salina]
MRVLLTGASGQVGHEIERLTPTGFELLARTSSQLGITDASAVQTAVSEYKPAIIMNAAAYTAVDQAESESERAWSVNQIGPANLGKAAQSVGAVVFHLSTDYVFAGDLNHAYRETDSTGPTGVYGASKLAGEQALLAQLQRSLILRTSWVFGVHGKNFVKTMLKLSNEREELRVVADQRGCPTSAASIANCLWELAVRYQKAGDLQWGTYHFAGSPACTWHDFAQEILNRALQSGLLDKLPALRPITTQDYPTPAQRPAFSVLDCSLIQNTFGICQPDWRVDLDKLLEELRQD